MTPIKDKATTETTKPTTDYAELTRIKMDAMDLNPR